MQTIILPNTAINVLKEAQWNYHFDTRGRGEHTREPYRSDNKFRMFGRETGHFGSGTYFSTYKGDGYNDKYGSEKPNHGEFIQVDDKVYRVDMDMYKNLFRVRKKRVGDILYTMCRNLNRFYNRIDSMGQFSQEMANYDNADVYQIIRNNANALGLKCPSYLELTRMAQRHEGIQSFSTLFMEWNGFNGVNVSGVEYYDNTKHGSVIYDVNKISREAQEVLPKSLYVPNERSYDDMVPYDILSDYEIGALQGKDSFWYDKLGSMPMNRALRILKNYTKSGKCLDMYVICKIEPELQKRYLRMICSTDAGDEFLKDKYAEDIIKNNEAWWFANHRTRSKSGLLEMLHWHFYELGWDLSEEEEKAEMKKYIKELEKYMARPIDEDEQYYIKRNYL